MFYAKKTNVDQKKKKIGVKRQRKEVYVENFALRMEDYLFLLGLDLKTGEEVAIKFSPAVRYYSLEKEYVNYLYLGADGRVSVS